ncbi:MAG: class II aldolase [Rhizobiales bacterium]|nr:class II aldolase [Hyphomicrobiales bacterium]
MIVQNRLEPPAQPFAALRKMSAQIGRDPMLVQAAGGNTSVKHGDVMWIKASGTLLADAVAKDIFVPVDLPDMQKALQANEPRADQPAEFLIPGSSQLRPSIETSLHAVFSQAVVVHVHCVHTLAHAILENRETLLAQRLEGFEWALVPYAKPGANLARIVRGLLEENPKIDVIILGNHGLIVAGDSVEETHQLLNKVHEKLAISPNADAKVDLVGLQSLASGSAYELPYYLPLHQLALDEKRVQQAIFGSLYPDHVIFCGIAATALNPNETLDQAAQRVVATGAPPPVFVIVPECGVLMRKDASSGAIALMRCLTDVLSRVSVDAELIYLSTEQNLELLDWDAEKYRQALNAK